MKWKEMPLKRRLKAVGVLVLLLGATSAVLVYSREARYVDLANDPLMSRYYREETRQAEIVYGTIGSTAIDIRNSLARPRTQAIVIAGSAIAIASVCFFFAGLPKGGDG